MKRARSEPTQRIAVQRAPSGVMRSVRAGGRAWVALALLSAGCSRTDAEVTSRLRSSGPGVTSMPAPLALVLAPHAGDGPLDRRIRALQARIPTSKVPSAELERLGWTFVALARERSDPGAYNLALQAALAMRDSGPESHAALLLRGHALHSLHRFREAEAVARKLVSERGLPFDHGLLGDVLIDRGALDEAIAAYQRMMDQRPDMHAYARAAHARYLKGDATGARAAMERAAKAASPRNRESFAWTWSKLALYQLQTGDAAGARQSVASAKEVSPDSPHALTVEARIALFEGALEAALPPLRAALARSPHPDLRWMLYDTLAALGHRVEAAAVHAQLLATGEREDPRALALYLATRGIDLARAEALVSRELAERSDGGTLEVLAWVQSARGAHARALESVRRALRDGTDDARMLYHAGLIAERAGARAEAAAWLARAQDRAGLLLPSQRALLNARAVATARVD